MRKIITVNQRISLSGIKNISHTMNRDLLSIFSKRLADKKIKLPVSILLLGFVLVMNACSPGRGNMNPWPKYFIEAGEVTVSDPMASLTGSLPYDKENIKISLIDVAKYTGHVCAGVASGFIMTKMALKELYLDGIPKRGQIRLKANEGHDLLDVAAYITGARAHFGRGEINQNDISIDPSLGNPQLKKIIIFERKDNGKKVKAVFHVDKMIQTEKRKRMKEKMMRVLSGNASDQEKSEVAQKIQGKVKKIMKGGVKNGIISLQLI